MADLREITVDETTTVTKDYLSNDVFLLNNEILKSSTQQVQFLEQIDKPDQLSTSSFMEKEARGTKISNDSESDRQCLWNRVDKLYTANESNKEHFSSCIKSTVNTMTEHQLDIPNAKEAGEYINDSRQLENPEYNSSRNNRKWPLFYFDENDKITSIKWINGPRFELEDAKADGDDDLSEKQPGIKDKETGDKVISMVNDNKNKRNLASDHMEGDLEQQPTSSNKKNSCFFFPEAVEARDNCFSFLEMQTQEANKNNERETITNNYKDEFKNENSSNLVVSSENNIKSIGVSNDKETDEDTSVCKQPKNIKYSNIKNNRKWPLFYIDENDKISSIKWIDCSRFELDDVKAEADDVSGTKQSGIHDKETVDKAISVINCNLNKLDLASSGIKGDLEQQTTSSNKKNACFSFFEAAEAQDGCLSSLVIPMQEVDKNYENEVETTTDSYKDEAKNENSSNFVGFSENDNKSEDAYSFQNQIFVKYKINVEENKFAPDSFIESYFINDRLQKENSIQHDNNIYNIQNKHSNMTFIEDEKPKYRMNTKGEILSPLTVINNFEKAPSNLKDEHAGDTEDTIWKESRRSYDNISLNLANEKQLDEGESEKDFFYETNNSTSVDLITWYIPYEKSESRAIQKVSRENSEKLEQKKENFKEKVHSSVNFSENILPEFENEHLEYTNDMISSKPLFNHACVSLNSVNNEVIANKGKIYRTNFYGKTGSSGTIDLFSSGISDEKTESQVYNNENENTSNKQDENKGRIAKKYHDENIVKEDEINSRFDKEHTREERNNTHKQKDLKQDGKQTDLYCSENNLSVTSTKQMLHDKRASDSCEGDKSMHSYDLKEKNISKNDLNVAEKGFIDKITPKFPELVKIKDDLFDKIPSKELNASQVHEDELNDPQIHEDELNATEKGFINELKPKTSKLKKLSCNLLGKIPPKLFLTAVGYDSEKTKCERLENECNNDHKYNSMLFGHCLECVPIESKKTVKETRATRILPDGSFAYDCDIGRWNRKKSRSVKQCNALENSGGAKSKEKRVTFAKDIGIFSYHPERSVFEDFHNYTDAKQKEHFNEKEIRVASEKVPEAMKGDIADKNLKDIPLKASGTLSKPEEKSIKVGDTSAKVKAEHPETKETVSESKESSAEVKDPSCYETENENMNGDTSSKAPGTVPKIEKKSTKRGDSSAEIKAGYSKIKETASDSTESLTEVVEPSYYDNIGFIDDWLPSCPSEIGLIDDPSSTFEGDEVSLSEKSCLIDVKTNTLPVKFSDLRSHTECKAKKWFKSAGSMTFKRLSLKKKKPVPEK